MSHELLTDARAADADLLTRVGIALTLRQRHALRVIHVEVENGVVTLSGEVPTFYDRQLAFAVTRRVAGVRRIRDELSVASRSFAGWERVGATAGYGEEADESDCLTSSLIAEQPAAETPPPLFFDLPWETGWLGKLTSRGYARRPSRTHRAWGLMLASLVLLVLGCSKPKEEQRTPVFPVTGTITFKGQPMPGAIVALHPKSGAAADSSAPTPRANVAKDGTFTVTTFVNGDGAPEGEYVLTVLWYKLVGSGFDVKAGPNVIPLKYAKPQTSDIEVRVAAGKNKVPPINL